MTILDSGINVEIGASVWHMSHGKGKISSLSDGYATIEFDESSRMSQQLGDAVSFKRLVEGNLDELSIRTSSQLKVKVPVDKLCSNDGTWNLEARSLSVEEFCDIVVDAPFTLDANLSPIGRYMAGYASAAKTMKDFDKFDPHSVADAVVESIDAVSGKFITRVLEKASRITHARSRCDEMRKIMVSPDPEIHVWTRLTLDRVINPSYGSVPDNALLQSVNVIREIHDVQDAVVLARALDKAAEERFRRWLMLSLESIKDSLDEASSRDWPELRRRLISARKGNHQS